MARACPHYRSLRSTSPVIFLTVLRSAQSIVSEGEGASFDRIKRSESLQSFGQAGPTSAEHERQKLVSEL
jgi:hypothetical protein